MNECKIRGIEEKDLPINKLEKLKGNIIELVIDRANDSLDGALNALHARFQWPRVLLRILIQL